MSDSPSKIPPKLDALPEPLRSTAFQNMQRMVESGYSEEEAIEKALLEADQWKRTDAASSGGPGTTTTKSR